jgi:branched-chain amino acid transport system permease protein
METAGVRIERGSPAGRAGLVVGAVALLGLASLPAWGDPSTMRILVEFIALLVLAQMWNLLAGYAGLVSIGQQAYVGLGGYALIVLADDWGVDPFVAVPLAGIVAALFALPTAAVVFRFRGGYFAVGTWAVAEVYRLVIANSGALGRGSGRTLKAVFPLARETREVTTYLLALAVGAAALIAVYVFLRSRYGLGLMAIRDSEPASETLGVDVLRTKVAVYVGVAFGTGVTGALIYLNLLRISPDAAFSINWTAYTILDRLHHLHRGDRGPGLARGPAARHRAVLRGPRGALRLRRLVHDPARRARGGRDARLPARALGTGGRPLGRALLSGAAPRSPLTPALSPRGRGRLIPLSPLGRG